MVDGVDVGFKPADGQVVSYGGCSPTSVKFIGLFYLITNLDTRNI